MKVKKVEQKRFEGAEILKYLEDSIRFGFKIIDVYNSKILMKIKMSVVTVAMVHNLNEQVVISFEVFDNNCVRVHSSELNIDRSLCGKYYAKKYMEKMKKIKTVCDFEKIVNDFISE